MFYYNRKQQNINVKIQKMNNQNIPQQSTPSHRNKSHKDYLYKIAKLKQNKILCTKDNDVEYKDQQKHSNIYNEENGENSVENDDDFDIQLVMPSQVMAVGMVPEPSHQKIIEVGKEKQQSCKKDTVCFQNESYKQEVQSRKNVDIISNVQKSVGNVQKNVVLFEDESQQSQQSVEQNKQVQHQQMALAHKLITFQDFDIDQCQPPIKRPQKQHPQAPAAQSQRSAFQTSSEQQQIKGLSITTNSLQGNITIKITNKKQLIFSRIPPGVILKCLLRRSTDIFNPEYDFYLHNGLKHIMSAKKYSLAKKQIFKISLELGDYKDNHVIGSILANTIHSTYWLYRTAWGKTSLQYFIKAIIRYNKLVKNKEREMDVQLFVDKNFQVEIQDGRVGHQLTETGGLVLTNTQFTTKQNSSKNYVLYDKEDKQYEYLKMNKISDTMFEVEIQHPLSPLQAFAVCLTRFDAQLK